MAVVIQGDLIDLKDRPRDRSSLRYVAIQGTGGFNEDQMVVFAPTEPAKHTIMFLLTSTVVIAANSIRKCRLQSQWHQGALSDVSRRASVRLVR